MSFPAAIADQVLVACGRHCALCHTFCGLKIELHHIKQKAADGADSFDNCIPLCFDCHADMRSYDHKHPKGRKYTEDELIAHRDNWYRRYSGTGGAIASPEHIELDRAVFLKLRRELPYEGAIRPLRERYAGAPVHFKRMQPLYAYVESSGDPASEFLDADLEGQRATLQEALEEYVEQIVTHTSPSERNAEQNTFASDRKYSDPESYYAQLHEISRLEARVVDLYSKLVRAARNKLGIDIPDDEA